MSEGNAQLDGRSWAGDLRICLIFLTRLPLAWPDDRPMPVLAQAMRAFGLAGAVVGLVCAMVLAIGMWFGFSAVLASLVAVAAATLVSGALHEDGLADVADGFGGGAAPERKLEIMRDSRIGAYGVLALVFSVGLRVFALAGIVAATTTIQAICLIVAVAITSRAAMGWTMAVLPNARDDGRSAEAGRPGADAVRQLLISSIFAAVPLLWWGAGVWGCLVVLFMAGLAALSFKRVARKQIGGQTGDVLGASQQISELTQLATLVALLA